MLFYENFVNFIIKNKSNSIKYDLIIDIYKNFSNSDIYDHYIYKTLIWDIIKYNYYAKLIQSSYIINLYKNNISSPINLKYSSLLNKYSLEFINIKLILNIIQNMSYYSNSLTIQDIIILLDIYFKDKRVDIFNYYDINKIDIKKIQKFL